MSNLSSTYINQGRWEEAEELVLQILDYRKRALGPKHPLTLTSMANLALIFKGQGRLQEAEDLEMQVAEISRTVLGKEHSETLTSMANLPAHPRLPKELILPSEVPTRYSVVDYRVLWPGYGINTFRSTHSSSGRDLEAWRKVCFGDLNGEEIQTGLVEWTEQMEDETQCCYWLGKPIDTDRE